MRMIRKTFYISANEEEASEGSVVTFSRSDTEKVVLSSQW